MPYGTYDPLDIIDAIEKRIGGDSITALVSVLGRLDKLDILVEALGIDIDTLGSEQTQKVLVMGASMVSVDELRSITSEMGFDRDWFEYILDYKKITTRTIGRLRNSNYSAVIVGPMPHSVKGKGDASSAIQRMKMQPGIYPPVIEAHVSSGLKITVNSFRDALTELNRELAA